MSEQQPEDEATPTDDETNDRSDDQTGDQTGETGDSGRAGLEESGPGDIGDDKLPEDLQPTEDNPLARHPGQTGDDDDKIGADTEGGDAANPSSNMAYGSEDSNAPSEEPDSDQDEDSADEDSSDED